MKLYEDESVVVSVETTEEVLESEEATEAITEVSKEETKEEENELGLGEIILLSGFAAIIVFLLMSSLCELGGNKYMKLYEDESVVVSVETTEEVLESEEATEAITEVSKEETKEEENELGLGEIILLSGFVAIIVFLLMSSLFGVGGGFYDPDRMY